MADTQSKTNKIQSIYNLSPMQGGMLFHKMLNEDSSEYVVQSVYVFDQKLNEDYARDSLELLSDKYDVLRTLIFYKKSEKKRQVVLNRRIPEMSVIDLSSLSEEEKNDRIEELKKRDVARGFDLEQDTLLRMTVIRAEEARYYVFWTIHHIIIDGWSTSLIFRDFMKYYSLLETGRSKAELGRLVEEERKQIPSYRQYIELIEKKDLGKSLGFFKDYLEDYVEPAEIIPVSKIENKKHKVNRISIPLSETLSEGIRKLSRDLKVTVSTVLEVIYGTVLSGYANTRDVVFGKVVSGRNVDIPQIEQAVGLFINTIPVRMTIEDDSETFSQLLRKMQEKSLVATEHEYCPLAEILQQTPLGNKLFDTLFVYENYFVSEDAKKGQDILNGRLVSEREETSYPITVSINGNTQFNFSMMYDTDIFTEEECYQLLNRMKKVAEAVSTDSDSAVVSADLMLEEDVRLINSFNDTHFELDLNKTLIQYFEENARNNPELTAVKYRNDRLTYAQLDQKASVICGLLRAKGIGPGDFVGVITTRSLEMMVGIFGIIKTGAAYVPIDREYPQERIDYILEDCRAKVVVTNCNPTVTDSRIEIIDLCREGLYEENMPAASVYGKPEDAVYVIYTSGTTGKPKGVVNVNRGMINRILWMQREYPLDSGDCILQKTTYTFDVSVWELFWWSVVGASVCMLGQGYEKEPKRIYEEINASDVTVLHFVPTMFNSFLNYLDEKKTESGSLGSLRYIFASGEALSPDSVRNWLRISPKYSSEGLLVNLYGPTEASIDVTYYVCDHESEIIPIGRPIQNTQMYVIRNGKQLGIGMPGELCIGGTGLAREYLNMPEMTGQKFISNPFGEGRIYRTGDLAMWMPDGNIRYLGRIDNQVKIRGFRIELGEIETALLSIEEINQAAVIVRNDKSGDKAIFAYFTAGTELDIRTVRSRLKEVLPVYMIPSGIMQIEKIPFTANGKLGTRLLPDMVYGNESDYVAPVNDTQSAVAKAFEEVLVQNRIGIKDNFFEMGGHSLKVVTLIHKLESSLGKQIPIKAVFDNPTPEQLAGFIDRTGTEAYEALPQTEAGNEFEMYSAQRRMFVIEQMEGRTVSYHIPAAFHLYGEVDREKADNAWKKLIERHEILRTSFHCIDGRYIQRIHENVENSITWSEAPGKTAELLMKTFVRPFDEGEYPLARMEIAKLGEKDYIMMLDVHHIIADGMSLNILIEEFSKLYAGAEPGENEFQYRHFSEWMRKRDFSGQKEYWKKVFEDEVPVLDLPTDFRRPEWQSFNGSRTAITFDRELRRKIEQCAVNTGTTEHIVLLSGLMVLLRAYSRQEDIVVGTPIAGRTHRDTDRMLGMFVNTLALRGRPQGDRKFIDFLYEMKNVCLASYENQEYPFEEVVEMLHLRKDVSRNPLFDVMFEMKNNEDTYSNIPGLAISYESFNIDISKFDISVEVSRTDEEYQVSFEYCTDLFDKDTILYMMRHFRTVMDCVTECPELLIKDIDFCDSEERKTVTDDFNRTDREYPSDVTVKDAFERTVAEYGDRPALVFKDRKVTYSQLNSIVNRESEKIRAFLTDGNEYVLLCAERGIGMIVGMLAIIKAGAAYVPIAPDYPEGRIREILDDCGAKLAVTSHAALPEQLGIQFLEIDETDTEEVYPNPESRNVPEDNMYTIFTSGTTGKPKGVMISHRNVMNLIYAYTEMYHMSCEDSVLQTANFVFDQSVWNIFNTLLVGGSLVLISDDDLSDPEILEGCCRENHVSIVAVTPTLAAILDPERVGNVRMLETGGEAANPDTYRRWMNGNIEIFNTYGPTETTVNASTYKYVPEDSRVIPIGKPAMNYRIYIMNGDRLCPIGVPGELCIAGAGVSSGYLSRPELTAEKFVENPFGEGKLYRTGDLALYRPDGNIVCLGRMDEQVKIRGFRIELWEIDSLLRQMEEIKDCAVIVRQTASGDNAIFAYFTSDLQMDCGEIRDRLRQKLPFYMIPTGIAQLEEIPKNRSGKLDKRSLPEIEGAGRDYVEPQNANEQLLADIIRKLLQLKEINIAENFFEIGGDSIKAIHVASSVREQGKEIKVRDILKADSIKAMAACIREPEVIISQEEFSGEYGLTAIQKFFFRSGYASENHYNQSMMIKTKENIELSLLDRAFDSIVRHHDVLRSRFENGRAEIRPYSEDKPYEIREYSFENPDAEEIEGLNGTAQKELDIRAGRLIRVNLYHINDETHIFMAVHHLVMDAFSWGILCEDLGNAYNMLKNGQEAVLPRKTVSFPEWSSYLNRLAHSDEAQAGIEAILAAEKKIGKAGLTETATGLAEQLKTREYILDRELDTEAVNRINGKYNTNLEELLLCALGIALKRTFSGDEYAVEMESHGRNDYGQNVPVDRTIGWFTGVYPVILDMTGENLEELILRTKEYIRNNQEVERFYSVLAGADENGIGDCRPNIGFNFLGDMDSNLSGIGDFTVSEYGCGDNISPLNVENTIYSADSYLAGKRLYIRTTYNAGRMSAESEEKLSNEFIAAFDEIISLCTGDGKVVHSASDFGAKGMQQDEFDEIFGAF